MDGPAHSSSQLSALQHRWTQRLQVWLDKSAPHITYRWLTLLAVILIYLVRVWYLRGFFIVTYGIGIFNLNLLIGFLTPQIDPESDGPELPTKSDEEFRPFIRRLPEFKCWYSSIKSVLIGLFLTFFKFCDIPVFWPILLLYWFVLFFVMMKRQIRHMIKYRYVPFSIGKKRYTGRSGEKRPEKDAKEGSPPPSLNGSAPAVNPVQTGISFSSPPHNGPPATFPVNRFPAATPLTAGFPTSPGPPGYSAAGPPPQSTNQHYI